MTPEPDDQASNTVPFLRPGKDEMNFAEFPIALLTDRVPKGQRSIEFEDQIFDPKRKKLITRRRIIDGSDKYGLPTATDDAVILALIQLTKQKNDFNLREIEFTRLELIKLLGWSDEGRNYERLKNSLIRISNVTYTYDNAWWDNRQKTWVTKVFHIIDTVEINDSRVSGRQNCLFPSRVVWNEVVFDSFQASFLRDIDFQLCIRLEHPIALRMYRFLGKRFHVKPEWLFDLKEFARDHMGLGQNYEGGTQIARKLKPAIKELEELSFLEPLTEDVRFQKKGREWSVRFVQKSPSLPSLPDSLPPSSTVPVPLLVTQLIDRGVTPKTAAELVAAKDAEIIASRLEVFDWLSKQKSHRFEKSPAGFLVSSIRDEYAPPPGFVPLAEQNRLSALKQASERLAAEARQNERVNAVREKREREAINAYRDALTPAQLKLLEAEAVESVEPEIRENLAITTLPDLKQLLLGRIVDDHIRKIVQRRHVEA